MAEYLELEKVLDDRNIITVQTKEYGSIEVITVDTITDIELADVQPVEKWCEYGFEYREPAEYGYYLTYYHGRIHVSEWSVSGWYNETGLPIDDDVVEYWQPLPKPPVND